MGKRKKLKSRSSAALPASILNSGSGGGGGYSKDHLDAWLETCLKDASTTQLSSSSEFLDYNPTTAATVTNSSPMSANNLNQKNLFSLPQQQQQQQQSIFNISNMNQLQQQQQQPMITQQQQQFAMRTTNPINNNLPNSNSSFNFPFSQGFQRVSMHCFVRGVYDMAE